MREETTEPNEPASGPLRTLWREATSGLRGVFKERLSELLEGKELGWLLVWFPVMGAAASLWASVASVLRQRAVLLARGELVLALDAQQLETLRDELIALWETLPEGMQWIEGAQRLDALYESWLEDERGLDVLLGLLGELEARGDALLQGFITRLLDDEVRADPAQTMRWIARADALLKQLLEEVILPRVLALSQPKPYTRRSHVSEDDGAPSQEEE